jgi:hypothetical protein
LSHQVHENLVAHRIGNKLEDGLSAALNMTRHHKMSDDHATVFGRKNMIPFNNLTITRFRANPHQTPSAIIIPELEVRQG